MDASAGSTEHLYPVFFYSPDAMIFFDLASGRIEDANDAALKLYGRAREEMIGRPMLEFSADSESTQETVKRLDGGETVRTLARALKRKDGSTFYVDGHATAMLVRGRRLGLSINRDVTAALRMQADLAESELRFRQMAENISQVFWMTDADNTKMEYISPRYETIFGRSCASLYADHRTWLEAILPEDIPAVIAAFEKDKSRYDGVYRIRRQDGEIRSIWARTFPVTDPGGRLIRVAGVAQDVTEQRKDEERLRESEAFLTKAQEIAKIGSWAFDITDQRVHWSRELCRILGVEYAYRRPFADFAAMLHPDDRAPQEKIVAAALASGEAYATEFRSVRPDGAVIWLTARASIVRDASGKAVKMVGICNDVTESRLSAEKLRAAELQTHESQKMEAVGRLAGGIAHDFNNILTAILGLAKLSIDALPEDHPVRRDLAEIFTSGQRAAKLTQQLLSFSRRQAIVPKVVGLDDAVLGVTKMLRSIIGENIKLAVVPGADGACILADPGQLEQLIVNLAVNARDAMPQGGTLTIRTALKTIDAGSAAVDCELKPGDYAALRVTDTGTGMPEEVRARIFEPFFTTKEQGKGTGLGLATCYGIVKQNGGSIRCDSQPGHGASFLILLPRCESSRAVSLLPPRPEEAKGTERILIVEDEEPVRRVAVRMLRARGFDTVEARDGQEGLEVLGLDTEHRIRLIVSDMVMPRLGGRKMAAAAAGLRPDVKVLFISGYADGIAEESAGGDIDLLAKPFSAEELTRRVRLALDAVKV